MSCMAASANQTSDLRLLISPAFVVMATFFMKWFVSCQGCSVSWLMSTDLSVHLRSLKGELGSELRYQPLSSSASFTQGYQPVMQNTLASAGTAFLRRQSAKSLCAQHSDDDHDCDNDDDDDEANLA